MDLPDSNAAERSTPVGTASLPGTPPGVVNPGYEADMLRRAALACRNFRKQAVGNTEWFDWVPAHLSSLAHRLDPAVTTEDAGAPSATRDEAGQS